MSQETRFLGIVEGFFSWPEKVWSAEERNETLSFMLAQAPELNTYFYCPKNDPYVTERWSESYPEIQATELTDFIERCSQAQVQFVYGLNPELEAKTLNNESARANWVSCTVHKLESVLRLGCEHVCLLFDDIPVAYDVVDGSLENAEPLEHLMVSLVNEVFSELGKSDEWQSHSEFWFCSPDYCFIEQSSFTEALQDLHQDIPIVWTGNAIFVRDVTQADLNRVQELLGTQRKLLFWLNYPVNDAEHNAGIFNVGAFPEMRLEVTSKFHALLVNPMRECHTNFPFYSTFSKYLNSPDSYQRKEAWRLTLEELFGVLAPSWGFIIQEFSACNIIDDAPKFLFEEFHTRNPLVVLDEAKQHLRNIGGLALQNDFAQKSLSSLELLYASAENYISLCQLVLEGTLITQQALDGFDVFPTHPGIDRYFPEILSIVRARLAILAAVCSEEPPGLEELSQESELFSSNKKGSAKLSLTSDYSSYLIELNQQALQLEQGYLLQMLNSDDVSANSKLCALALRCSLNRFTLTQDWVTYLR